MDRLSTAHIRRVGSRTSEIQNDITTNSALIQRAVLFEYLLIHKQITTLEARNELFIMAPAARIFELKERGHNIITQMVPAYHGCKRNIANYVLLAGEHE